MKERMNKMEKLGLNEIREKYLRFFEGKEHLRMPSFSLVPQNDPSLLLVNAGMAPLKPYFTGKETPPSKRVVTCQKCIRTPDIERVGKTARHGTFFEMLGNFSFADYFKKEATTWAWEFVTETLNIPIDRLWVSIYEEDDEAFKIWTEHVGVSPSRVVRMGKEDNFWEHGTGPCGPCSEIYFDMGETFGCNSLDCAVGCDCDRYVEFWNLVFTQFDKDESCNYNPLPNPNIDTGMGLERLAAMMQGVGSIFEVDTVRNIMKHISNVTGVTYKQDEQKDVSLRVITDHIRSTTFMISDGILPSNEGRGYVLRRLLRRAARHGKLLGVQKQFLWEVAQTVIDESKEAYPALDEKKEYIQKVIQVEEQRFDETIDQGLNILNQFIERLKKEGQQILSGENAFKLYDTYGFPIDLTIEILAEQGMHVDRETFDKEMDAQRNRAREARQASDNEAWGSEDIYTLLQIPAQTNFVGYGQLASDGKILGLLKDNQPVDKVLQGDAVIVILDKTPFYGESGGQIGDTGIMEAGESKIRITDCKKAGEGKILHIGTVDKGQVQIGDAVTVRVDANRRKATGRNHTATHLLQKALREVLGEHVNQAGSLVEPQRLRFDFSHFSAMTPEEIEAVEKSVNMSILEGLAVNAKEMSIEEARQLGATALFGEKYGDVVRVVKMGDYSIELCGGTHLDRTSEIGVFKIVSENGVAAGVRRIEAVTGVEALDYFKEKEKMLHQAASVMKTQPNDLVKKATTLIEELKEAKKEIESLKSKLASGSLEDIIAQSTEIKGIRVVTARMDTLDMDGLRKMGDQVRDKLDCGIVLLASGAEGKVSFIAMATKKAVAKGIHIGNMIRETAKIAGGGGGGRPDMAQAGGKDASKIDEALSNVSALVKNQIEK